MFVRARTMAKGVVLVSLWCNSAIAQMIFTDVSASRGIGPYQNEPGMGSGLAAADFDDDGYVDVFVPQAAGVPDQLYHNLGNGSFAEIAPSAGVASTGSSRVALWIDYDGDGALDLFVANDDQNAPSSFRLYRQVSPAQFIDVTSAAGMFIQAPVESPGQHHWGGICAGDIDNDGFLDIYTGQWPGPGHLFLNTGLGSFVEISAISGVGVSQYVHQSMMADFNEDGWMDIYVAVDGGDNILWINQHDRTFVDEAIPSGCNNAMNDMGLALGDYDNDNDLDIYITNISGSPNDPQALRHNVLFRNDSLGGSMQFTDVSLPLAVAAGYWGWGTTLLDGDRDGYVDVAATNGWSSGTWATDPSRFFLNTTGGAAPFADVSAGVGFDDTHYGSSLISFDFDRDGDMDLMQVCMGGPLRLLDNTPVGPSTSNGYLVVKPRMAGPNHYAIGAVVRIQAGGEQMMRLITAGTSYMGQEPAEAFFGLGGATRVDTLTIQWPDGTMTTKHGLTINRVITVEAQASVPAVSQWGMVVTMLLILVAATILLSHRRGIRRWHIPYA